MILVFFFAFVVVDIFAFVLHGMRNAERTMQLNNFA